MENLTSCPICQMPEFRAVQTCLDYTVSRETFTICECKGCGFWFTNPRPAQDQIGSYYESEEYISHSGKTKGLIGSAYKWVRNYTLKGKLSLVESRLSSGAKAKLLDIGCGTGEFLNLCTLQGHEVVGIEPSYKARSFAKEAYNLDVREEAELGSLISGSFDVVSMWHVLEHVHKLKERVGEIRRLLKPGGTALIAVPNRLSWDALKYGSEWAAYDVPRHLYHFRREDIKRLFEEFDFTLESTIPMKFDSYYVSMLSSKNSGRGGMMGSTWNGFVSNWNASTAEGTWSSQIYVLKRKD